MKLTGNETDRQTEIVKQPRRKDGDYNCQRCGALTVDTDTGVHCPRCNWCPMVIVSINGQPYQSPITATE